MDVTTDRAGWVTQRTFSRNSILRNLVATQREAPMKRLATSLGTLIALMAIASVSRRPVSYAFSIGGHRFHVEAPQ